MIILGIDTSQKNGSIALVRGDSAHHEVIAEKQIEGGTFSAQLIPQLAAMLSANSLRKEDIDAFAVNSGPGSFTGLRIGLSAVKGLAEILLRPVVAVTALEALADGILNNPPFLVATGAGRGEFYVGFKESAADGVVQSLLKRDEVLVLAKTRDFLLVSSDYELAAGARAQDVRACHVAMPGSAQVAAIGLRKLVRGETVTLDALDANYIRRDDNLFTRG